MSKEFNVPCVVFPSGGNPGLKQRRPMAPFQPRNSKTTSFMSFDVGSAAPTPFTSLEFGSTSISSNVSSNTNVFDEPPLLEELGINTRQIWNKTSSILNPVRINPNLHDDADLSGPFLLLMAFGLFQLLAGKIHFGIILGWVTVAALFLYVVFNMLAGRNGTLDLHRCVSLLGYCMLPMVILSVLSLFLPQAGVAIFVIAAIFVIWSTRVCTKLLIEVGRWDEHRGLVAYACFLIYSLFSLLVIF
ncbi:uncharacterized protein LOC129293883 [Prosopis cineraria]|uniref:uncharacterized protein LOC129293883 n=1 Tax=Prosopis cineraria TaxID=364024 RepID=UPI00241020E7|nr:uncharacterized protein LOC129293883 [Prosopis cineraria]